MMAMDFLARESVGLSSKCSCPKLTQVLPHPLWPASFHPLQLWVRAASSASGGQPPQSRKYAVLGAGFAGVSVAWHLLQYCNKSVQVNVELYDEKGIGAGASGISGGLLHPYSPKGKLVWKGQEGWNAALELLAVAETAAVRASKAVDSISPTEVISAKGPIAWRRGIIRPSTSPKHTDDFRKLASDGNEKIAGLSCINGKAAKQLVPGLAISRDELALHITEGISIDPLRYLQALWTACEQHALDVSTNDSPRSQAVLKITHISSLSCLSEDYDAIIICLGPDAVKLPELAGQLPIKLCRGVVSHLMLPPEKEGNSKFEGPSIIAGPWLAVRGQGRVVLGATKEWNNSDTSTCVSPEVANAACDELFTKAAVFYPPIKDWTVENVYGGVRVMTKRTLNGKLPLTGCIDDIVLKCNDKHLSLTSVPRHWLLSGLGSRGLIYHAWLGKLLAEAVITKSEACLPRELLEWKYASIHRDLGT